MVANWPSAIRAMVDVGDAASSPGSGFSLACVLPAGSGVDPVMAMHAFFAGLPVAAAVLVAAGCLAYHLAKGRREGERRQAVAGRFVTILVVVFFLVVTSIAKVPMCFFASVGCSADISHCGAAIFPLKSTVSVLDGAHV